MGQSLGFRRAAFFCLLILRVEAGFAQENFNDNEAAPDATPTPTADENLAESAGGTPTATPTPEEPGESPAPTATPSWTEELACENDDFFEQGTLCQEVSADVKYAAICIAHGTCKKNSEEGVGVTVFKMWGPYASKKNCLNDLPAKKKLWKDTDREQEATGSGNCEEGSFTRNADACGCDELNSTENEISYTDPYATF